MDKDDEFFKELHQINREDEFRYKMLMQGLRRILDEKKKGKLRNKLKKIRPKTTPHWG